VSAAARSRDLVFVGDVHLDRDDEHLEPFLEFLESLRDSASRVVLMGDLFNLWIGQHELELPHQTAVLERLESLRSDGIMVRYLEGNRDFRIARAYAGRAVDDAPHGGIEERFGGKRLFAIHGDLTNPKDHLYRLWRRVARSPVTWLALRAFPPRRRFRIIEGLEDRLRRANQEFKQEFPESHVRSYAAQFLARGNDAVVLGHFHVEKDLEARPPSAPGRILVLPEWKGGRRYLRVTHDGHVQFTTFAGNH
jgi:UDP-2,3-diacylglucosamine hydrolase